MKKQNKKHKKKDEVKEMTGLQREDTSVLKTRQDWKAIDRKTEREGIYLDNIARNH